MTDRGRKKMKNKILITSLAALCALLIFETGYLVGLGEERAIYRMLINQYGNFRPMRYMLPVRNMPREMAVPPAERLVQQKSRSFFVAAMTSKEMKDANIITINLPGLNKEDIKIEAKGRYLIVQAKQKKAASVNKKNFYAEELSAAAFMQTVTLPENAKAQQIRAEFKEDTLTITIPKDKRARKAPETAMNIPIK